MPCGAEASEIIAGVIFCAECAARFRGVLLVLYEERRAA